MQKPVEEWTLEDKNLIANQHRKLLCDNIVCYSGVDVLNSLWSVIDQIPPCGLGVILCAAAQEIDALRKLNEKNETL
ncbi:hypothetical protein GW796_09260 [archaeon]|nr:hypothetical protein [archaeon]